MSFLIAGGAALSVVGGLFGSGKARRARRAAAAEKKRQEEEVSWHLSSLIDLPPSLWLAAHPEF